MLVDCRGAGLNKVPDNIPDVANEIDLSDNNINKFESNNFDNCSNVKSLNLERNSIRNIPQDLFQSMLDIETIALNENSLQYNNRSFPQNPFQNLT